MHGTSLMKVDGFYPTLGANGKPDTSRIEAVGKILREWKPQAQK